MDPAGHPLAGIRYIDGARVAEAHFRHGPGRGVRRTTLHAALRDAVDAAGVPVEARAVRSIEQDDDRVLVDGEPARFVLAADGLHSPVRRLVGLDAPSRAPRRFGLRGPRRHGALVGLRRGALVALRRGLRHARSPTTWSASRC